MQAVGFVFENEVISAAQEPFLSCSGQIPCYFDGQVPVLSNTKMTKPTCKIVTRVVR